ncbi:MAG: nuclear transport factor 2 family protein [Crocinitomicaceae bacterium]
MKTLKIITLSIFTLLTFTGNAQNKDIKNIKKTITQFALAADNNNDKELATYLDDNYRIVMNRLFGSESISIMSKSVYLEKIKSKEYGGDTRTLTFENVIINGNTASAKVILKGEKMTFISLFILVKDNDNNWKLISDTPVVS